MPENKNAFRRSLDSVLEARSREVSRHIMHQRAHLLLGALTKRPA